MDFRPGSIDDYDWSSTAPVEEKTASVAQPPEPEPPPPPIEPAARRRGASDFTEQNRPGTELLPAVYREGAKNVYKRRQEAEFNPGSLDDYNWGESSPAVSGQPAYDPNDDYAITRGFKVAADQGTQSITAMSDMTRILGLPTTEQQVAEMIKIGQQTADPSDPKLAIKASPTFTPSARGMSYLGESVGQMIGSMYAAATTGGAVGAAGGAAIGGGVGALAGGAGAIPGAIAGGITGFTRGTLTSFMGMGIGGTFRELLQDKGVQEALQNGTVKPDRSLQMGADRRLRHWRARCAADRPPPIRADRRQGGGHPRRQADDQEGRAQGRGEGVRRGRLDRGHAGRHLGIRAGHRRW